MDYQKLMEHRNNNSGFGINIGIKISHISQGFARGELKINDDHLNQIGIVHGGALFSLADTIAGSAAASSGYKMVTLNSSFNYLKAGENTDKIYAKAQSVRTGRTIIVTEVELTDDFGNLLATGTFTFYNLGEELKL